MRGRAALLVLMLILPMAARGQRDETIYVDGAISTRYLWRSRDLGGGAAELGAGVPWWWTNPTQPQRGILLDARSWIPFTSWDSRKPDQQNRMRAQLVATSDKVVGDGWELRLGYAGYVRPFSLTGSPSYSSELTATLTAPLILERQNSPVRPYVSVAHDLDYFDGTRAALGLVQEKELFRTTLEWTLEASANDYGHSLGYEGIAFSLFAGKTPSRVTTDLVQLWTQRGITLDIIVPALGLKASRLGVGVRLGAGRSPPWIR